MSLLDKAKNLADKAKGVAETAMNEVKEHVVDPATKLAKEAVGEVNEHVVDPLLHKHEKGENPQPPTSPTAENQATDNTPKK